MASSLSLTYLNNRLLALNKSYLRFKQSSRSQANLTQLLSSIKHHLTFRGAFGNNSTGDSSTYLVTHNTNEHDCPMLFEAGGDHNSLYSSETKVDEQQLKNSFNYTFYPSGELQGNVVVVKPQWSISTEEDLQKITPLTRDTFVQFPLHVGYSIQAKIIVALSDDLTEEKLANIKLGLIDIPTLYASSSESPRIDIAQSPDQVADLVTDAISPVVSAHKDLSTLKVLTFNLVVDKDDIKEDTFNKGIILYNTNKTVADPAAEPPTTAQPIPLSVRNGSLLITPINLFN